MNHSSQKGFTLVELSIVLVIIGLIVSGVLVGQELIRGARIRSQVTQIQQFDTALAAFRVKYDSLPGDIIAATATAYGLTTGGGDNDGSMDDGDDDGSQDEYGGEISTFFAHLSDAEMIPGSYTMDALTIGSSGGVPRTALKRGGILPLTSSGNFIYFVGLSGAQTLDAAHVEAAIITAPEAFGVDNKLDDGFPATGKITAVTAVDTLDAGAAGGSTTCRDTTPTPDVYDIDDDSIECQIQVQSQAM